MNVLKEINGIETVIKMLNGMDVSHVSKDPKGGVYLLLKDGEIVYIGMSTIGISRVQQHVEKKEFDGYKYLKLPGLLREELRAIETLLIAIYTPKLNGLSNLDKKYVAIASAFQTLSK